jgi:hypothetical protein
MSKLLQNLKTFLDLCSMSCTSINISICYDESKVRTLIRSASQVITTAFVILTYNMP